MSDLLKKIANLPPDKRAALLAKLAKNKGGTQKTAIDYTRDFEYKFNSETPFDFSVHQTTAGDPGEDYVQVKAKASSLNFRDVMIATKQYPASPGVPANMGSDYAGVVTKVGAKVKHLKPGDEVIALLVGHSETDGTLRDNCHFVKTFNVHKECVVLKPKNLSFVESCCIPTVFLTSYIGLIELGRLQNLDKVLIHTASGGVGLSAIQIAQWKNAQIFATAGTPEKRSHLKQYGIKHIYDSRSTEFAEKLRSQKEELDVVLNTLAGDLMIEGLRLLKPFGRFIHLDKKDIAAHTNLDMDLLIKSVAFQFLDISLLFLNPVLITSSLQKIVALHEEGILKPLQHKAYPIAELKNAITAMSRGTHIGKLVVSYE